MTVYAVEYSYSPTTAEARAEQRPEHLAWLKEQEAAGRLLASGRFASGLNALLIWAEQDVATLRAVLAEDPYALSQLIDAVRVEEWVPTIGPFTAGSTP